MSETVETCPVAVTVLGVEPVRGAGRLMGLAVVELDIHGVLIRIQGIGITRGANGRAIVSSPLFRHPNRGGGALLPAAVLPPDLAAALAGEVLAAWQARYGAALGASLAAPASAVAA